MYPSTNPMQLVGRSRELSVLDMLLHRAKQSQGQVVFIVGEAGIGKTRLLTALCSLAGRNGFAIVRGESLEQDHEFPYAPIVDGLRTHFSAMTTDALRQVIGPYQPEMVGLLPELALRVSDTRRSVPLEPEAEKRRLFEVLVQVYQRLPASGLLLIFEDIHWCDVNSLEFFQTLTRRIGSLPIMIALSSRWAASDSEVAKLRLYLDRAENAQTIVLNPLPPNEIESLTKTVLQTSEPLHPLLMERLDTLAQGNPLYTEQIVYMLMQKRQINLVNGTWMITNSTDEVEIPSSIARTIEQHVERLSAPAKRVLQVAAVSGHQFDLVILQALSDLDELKLTAIVKDLIGKRFFEQVSANRFAFRHALLRQAIYDGLLIWEQRDLHRAVLQILEEAESSSPNTHLAELSYHAYQSEAWEAALHYGAQAGQHAQSLHAPRSAVEHFSHAIEASKQLSVQASWELYMQRGKAYDRLGDFQSARDDYEVALQAAARNDDRVAEWQTLIAIAMLWSARDYRHTETYCERALQLAQAMDEPALIGHSLNRLGNWFLNMGNPFEALSHHERALAIFRHLNDLPGEGETLDLLAMASGHALEFQDQIDYYRDAVMIFRKLDDRKALASALANLALPRLDPALAEEAIDIAHQISWYAGEAYACVTAGYVHSYYAHFADSFLYLQRAQELAQAIDHTEWLAGAYVFSAFVYRDLLELSTAADYLDKGVALAIQVGSHWFSEMGRGLLARIRIEQGKLDAAAELVAQSEVPDPPAMQHSMTQFAEAELALARGDAKAALSANERLWQAWHMERGAIPWSAMIQVPCLMIRARALAMSDRLDDALELLRRALQICEEQHLLISLWRVEVLLGKTTAAEDERASHQYFSQARDHVQQLAEHIPDDMRQRFLERAEKLITPESKRMKSAAHWQLTRRELDIAREIALGKTNQQIADELHITVKTVETHITRVLSKLDMTSRTQIALWMTENKHSQQ